jgi:hypothetical protein
MPDGWYPAAVRDPGDAAGYTKGRTPVMTAVCHFTVGRNSAPIGRQGYFQFLVARDGTVIQFAEADAVCWHAGSPWNGVGPGIEVEYLPGFDDEIFTPAAYDATARLCQWLHDEWGIPLNFYDGDRIVSFHGFITHRSLIQTGDRHHDWWPELPCIKEDDDLTPEQAQMLSEIDARLENVELRMNDIANQLYASPQGTGAAMHKKLDTITEQTKE